MAKILLADDERTIRALVERIVTDEGYDICIAENGEEALDLFARENPDLVILDVMMPDLDGYEVCRRLRDQGAVTPILFLTAKGEIDDMEAGFSVGGDDYLVKPFAPRELTLRIEAHLRRHERMRPRQQDEHLVVGDLEFDVAQAKVAVKGRWVDFTPKEFRILYTLACHPGEVFTSKQLIEAVWGKEFVNETSSMPVFIRKIREKIEDDPSRPVYLQTAWRSGYRLGD